MSTSIDGANGSKSQFDVSLRHCVAGGAAAAITKTATAPLDRIMVHMQVGDLRVYTHTHGRWYYNMARDLVARKTIETHSYTGMLA